MKPIEMRLFNRPSKKLLFHGFYTLISSIGPILSVFFILKVVPVGTWGAVAFGQAIGLFSSIFVSLGTNVSGSLEIANLDNSERNAKFLEISVVQVYALLPISLISFLITYLLSNDHKLLAGIGTISINISALTLAWYYFGTGNPRELLLIETIPRLFFILISLLTFKFTRNIYIQIVSQSIMYLLLYLYSIKKNFDISRIELSKIEIRKSFILKYKQRFKSSFIGLISALISITPILVLSLTANRLVPIWAIIDRVARYFSIVNDPITNQYRNITNRNDVKNLRSLMYSQIFIEHLLSGLALSFISYFSAPVIINGLSSGKLSVNHSDFIWISISLFFNISLKNPIFILLASRSNLGSIIRILLTTFIISIPMILLFTKYFALKGVCIGYFIMSFVNSILYFKKFKKSSNLF